MIMTKLRASLRSEFRTGVLLAVLAVAVTGEAKWTATLKDGWTLVLTDGQWTVSCYHTSNESELPKDGDGTVYQSPQLLHSITVAPEGGGDLDMSTLWEDVLEKNPTWTLSNAPVGMYGGFYSYLKSKNVTSIKFPSCLRVAFGWSASGASPVYNDCTTNVVFNEGLNTLKGGFLTYMTKLVSVSGLDTVRHIGNDAFKWCTELNTVDPFLPTGVVTIGSTAFSGCTNLTGDLVYRSPYYRTVSVSPGNPTSVTYCDGVTNIASGWGYNASLTNVAPYPPSLETISGGFYEARKDYVRLDFSACTNLTELRTDFAPFSGITEVILPPRIRTIGSGAFQLCTSLTNVGYVADMRFRDEMLAASGTVQARAFDTCTHLKSVTLPWGGTDTVIETNAFVGCWQLSRVKFEGRPPKTYPPNLFDGNAGTQCGGAGSYYIRILASKHQDHAAWKSFASRVPTDAERSLGSYPGSKTFGILEYNYTGESAKRKQWLVWEKSCWDLPQGMAVTIR